MVRAGWQKEKFIAGAGRSIAFLFLGADEHRLRFTNKRVFINTSRAETINMSSPNDKFAR